MSFASNLVGHGHGADRSGEKTVVVIPADTNPGLMTAIYLQQAFNKRSGRDNNGNDRNDGNNSNDNDRNRNQDGEPGSFGNERFGDFDLPFIGDRYRVRALAEDPSRCEEAKRRGAEVVRVNLDDANNIAEQSKGVCVFLVVPPTHGDIEQRSRNIEQALRQNLEQLQRQNRGGEQRILLFSCRGTDEPTGQGLEMLGKIERCFRQKLEHVCIIRVDIPMQYFHFWSDMVQREGRFKMLTNKEFRPIHFQDIGCASYVLLTGKHKSGYGMTDNDSQSENRQGKGRIYTLVGPEAVGPDKIAERYMKNVQFQKVPREELERYFKSLRQQGNNYLQEQQEDQQRRARGDNGSRNGEDGDRDNFRFPKPFPPSDFEIQHKLDYQEWIEQHPDKARQDTEDLRRITGSSGTRPEAFFQAHRDEFSGRRNK